MSFSLEITPEPSAWVAKALTSIPYLDTEQQTSDPGQYQHDFLEMDLKDRRSGLI